MTIDDDGGGCTGRRNCHARCLVCATSYHHPPYFTVYFSYRHHIITITPPSHQPSPPFIYQAREPNHHIIHYHLSHSFRAICFSSPFYRLTSQFPKPVSCSQQAMKTTMTMMICCHHCRRNKDTQFALDEIVSAMANPDENKG